MNWGTPKHSHSELEFVDRNLTWSSTNRDGSKGTRFAPCEEVYTHNWRWDYFEFMLTDEDEELMYDFCSKHCGKKYDWWGVGGFALFGINDPNKFYCSEGIGYALAVIRFLKFYRILSPRHLTKILLKKDFVMKSRKEIKLSA